MPAPARARARLAILSLALLLAIPMAAAPAQAASGLFLPYQAIAVPSEADAVAIGDVTGDGRADVVFTTGYDADPANDFHVFVLAQGPDGLLAPPVGYATAGSYAQRPGSVAIGDITGDGLADVVVGLDRYGIQVFPGQPDGTLGAASFTATSDSTRIRVGQLDGDGHVDVVGIGWGSDTVSVFHAAGGVLAPPQVYAAVHNGWDDLEVGDVNGDGRTDIIVMSGQGYGPNVSVLHQAVDGTFGPAEEHSLGDQVLTHGVGVGDTTGDGRADVVASYGGNSPSSRVALWTQRSDGTLGEPVVQTSYDIPEPVDVADLDLDGRADVVTLHGGWQQAGVYLGRADGTLGAEQLYPIPYASHYSVHGLAIGDVNGDGWPDVVAADYNNGIIILSRRAAFQPTQPGAPALLSATPGDGRVSLTWSAPASDGGSAITSYVAEAQPGGAYCLVTGLWCTITGLQNGTSYEFSVRAGNAIGYGPASNALTATPQAPGLPPGAPQKLVASPNLAQGIGLSWEAPASSGTAPISGYRVYRGAPGGVLSLHAIIGNTLSFVDTAAVNGASYAYQVSAVNALGEGPASATIVAQRGTAPSAPRSLSATVAAKSITLKWSAPSSTGGSAITGYRIYRSTSSGSESLLVGVGAGTTSYADSAVAKKTRYYYWVTAINALGESVASAEVTAVSH
jgi:fibronectin type 3 domain-containing protein